MRCTPLSFEYSIPSDLWNWIRYRWDEQSELPDELFPIIPSWFAFERDGTVEIAEVTSHHYLESQLFLIDETGELED